MPIFLPDNPYWEWYDDITDNEGTPYQWDRHHNYTRRHLVKVKIEQMGPIDVCLLGSAYTGTLPLPGTFYVAPLQIGNTQIPMEYDRWAIMTRQSAKRRSGKPGEWEYWIVTSEYSTEIPSRQDDPTNKDPEKDLAEIEWDNETASETKIHDLIGSPYLNTANVPLLKVPNFEQDYQVLRISRNEITYNYATAAYYTRALNNQTFLGAPRGCVQCLPPKALQKQRGVLYYWRVTYKLRIRPMQFNRTGSTTMKDLFTLPPLMLVLPKSTGDTTINLPSGYGTNSDPTSNALGMFAGDPVLDSFGLPIYDPVPGLLPAGAGQPIDKYGYGNPVRIWDSWQPLIQMEGKQYLGRSDTVNVVAPIKVGRPLDIEDELTHHNKRDSVLLDAIGQVSRSLNPNANPPTPPRAWFKQWIHYRYVDLTKLLVKGLT